MLDLLDIVIAAFEVDLVMAWSVESELADGGPRTYVFDGDQIACGLFDGLVNDAKTAAAQLFEHVIVVGHCGLSKSRVHCLFVGQAEACCGRHSRGGRGLTIEAEA